MFWRFYCRLKGTSKCQLDKDFRWLRINLWHFAQIFLTKRFQKKRVIFSLLNNGFNYVVKIPSQLTFTCSKLIIETLGKSQWRRSGVFIVNYEHISHLFLVFLLLTLNKNASWVVQRPKLISLQFFCLVIKGVITVRRKRTSAMELYCENGRGFEQLTIFAKKLHHRRLCTLLLLQHFGRIFLRLFWE